MACWLDVMLICDMIDEAAIIETRICHQKTGRIFLISVLVKKQPSHENEQQTSKTGNIGAA